MQLKTTFLKGLFCFGLLLLVGLALQTGSAANVKAAPNLQTTPAPTVPTVQPPAIVTVVPNAPATLTFSGNQGGSTIIQVPAGAVTSPIVLGFARLATPPAPAPSGLQPSAIVFMLDAYQPSTGTVIDGFVFQQPALVTINYTDADVAGLDENTLVVRYFDPATNEWRTDGISNIQRDPANNRISFTITAPRTLAIFGSPAVVTPTPTALPQPALTIGQVQGSVGNKVTVPVRFQRSAANVDAVVFSIDYDQTCLSFDKTDANHDNIPDAITFLLPANFTRGVTFDQTDTDGELDFVIASAVLPDANPLVTIDFSVTCTSGVAPVNFSNDPAPSFGAGGASVAGTATNGSVTITTAPPTATPVTPATATPVTPATATPVTPATATPVTPATATPVTPATATPVTPATATPVTPATATPVTPATATPVTPTSGLILISSDDNGKVDGVSFKDEDILAYNAANNRWALVFDGSDVGFGKVDLEAFDVLADGSILLVPSKKITIPGLGEVTPSDIVRFIPTSLGANTVGAFEWYFDGSDVGLSGSSEYIDAIAFDTTGRLLISTEGSFNAGGVKGNDEDLFAFSKTTLGATTAGTWALYFDGSRVALSKSNEDVNAAWVKSNGDIYLSTKGEFAVNGSATSLSGDHNDIFICKPLALGAATDCTFTSFFDGDAVRFKYGVDDVTLAASNQLRPFSVAAATTDDVEGEQFAVSVDNEQNDQVVDEDLTDLDLDRDELLTQKLFLPVVTKQ